ncbi:hypothetical protein RV04_GL000739 [Enterococcus hermanniensis]|uniref:HTH cro/C1-type domain-containing protein n=1 Tax=Enterococcus hermanniensis TaxID=249189 RepID=A0A1L8TF94_9ENTE|nr:hypothetical protein RV04_GL000739 [Enterococcus hermanniensis]
MKLVVVINLKRLKAERIANGITEAEMGKKLNKSSSIIYKYENGSRNLSIENFCKMIDVMGFKAKDVNIFFADNCD